MQLQTVSRILVLVTVFSLSLFSGCGGAKKKTAKAPQTNIIAETPGDEILVAESILQVSDAGAYNFGSVTVQSSTAKKFILKNQGQSTITNLNILVSSQPFALKNVSEANSCQNSLATSQSCYFTVEYSPQSVGQSMGSLSVMFSYQSNPYSISKVLLGNATEVKVGLLGLMEGMESYSFPPVASGSKAIHVFKLINNGTAAIKDLSFNLPPGGNFKFGIDSMQCGSILEVGQVCTVPVEFSAIVSESSAADLELNARLDISYHNGDKSVLAPPIHLSGKALVPEAKLIFTSYLTSIVSGGTISLGWSATYASGCVLNPGAVALPISGIYGPLSPATTTTYQMSCQGKSNTASGSVTVQVSPPPVTVGTQNAKSTYYYTNPISRGVAESVAVTGFGASGVLGYYELFYSSLSIPVLKNVITARGNECAANEVAIGKQANGNYCAPLNDGYTTVNHTTHMFNWWFNVAGFCPAGKVATGAILITPYSTFNSPYGGSHTCGFNNGCIILTCATIKN